MSDPNYQNPNQPPQGAPVPPQAPAYNAAPAQAPMNVLSLVSFIGSFFISLVGIICGHIALGQIKKTGERGRGFALAGLIIGYVSIALTIIFIIIGIMTAAAVSSSVGTLEGLDQQQQLELEQQLEELEF